MAYKLLGMFVWKAARWFLRRKYGAAMAPKPLLAGGLIAVLVGAALVVARQRGGIEG
jgi:hypothetical protein